MTDFVPRAHNPPLPPRFSPWRIMAGRPGSVWRQPVNLWFMLQFITGVWALLAASTFWDSYRNVGDGRRQAQIGRSEVASPAGDRAPVSIKVAFLISCAPPTRRVACPSLPIPIPTSMAPPRFQWENTGGHGATWPLMAFLLVLQVSASRLRSGYRFRSVLLIPNPDLDLDPDPDPPCCTPDA